MPRTGCGGPAPGRQSSQRTAAARASPAASAVKKPTVSTLLNGLRQRGWISDRTEPVDGRVVTVVLTPSGRKRLRAFDDQLAQTLESYISKADLPTILAALVRLYASLNEATQTRAAAKVSHE